MLEKFSSFSAVFSFSKETAVVIVVLKLPTVLSSICYTKEINYVKKNLISYCAFSLTHYLISFLSFFFGCRVYLNASLSISFTRASKWKQEFSFLEWKLFSLLIQHWPCPSSVTMENPAMPAASIQGLHMSITEGVHKRCKTKSKSLTFC